MKNLRFPGGKSKAFTLSFDDGVTEDRRFIEIINRYGLKGTFNLNSYSLTHEGGREKVSVEELGTLYKGHEIAVHTWRHPCPCETFSGNFAYEIMKDRELLEHYTGRIIRGMAYPMGSPYIVEDNIRTVRQCGIAYARTTAATKKFGLPDDWAVLNPTCHHTDADCLDLLDDFLSMEVRFSAQMYYLWGHTYEFTDRQNWELAEKIAETASGREDIWYASNIEIHDYVEAARRIVVSADGRMMYNPTCTKIWYKTNSGMIMIMPGETVCTD